MNNYINKRRSNMLTEITKEFLNKQPNDEEMMAFLKEHISARHLVPDDILSIIENLNDEKNKHKTIYRYVEGDILSIYMERVLNIILNIKDQRISEMVETIIIQRLEKLRDDNKKKNNDYNKRISHAIIGHISGLEQIGECDEKIDYIDRAKGLLEENVEESRIEEIDLMTFLYNIDFSRWNRQDLEKYEEFLNPEYYQNIMEMWEEAQEETKKLINGVIQEAKQQKISLEDLTKEFLKAVGREGINSDDLYAWILKSEAFNLVAEQRAELSAREETLETTVVVK